MGRQKRHKYPIDLRVDLETSNYPELSRQIGVLIGEPFLHVGMDVMMVDAEFEYPIVNTMAVGGFKPVGGVDEAIRKGLKKCIRECRAIRDELDMHAFRIGEQLKLYGGDPNDVEGTE